MEAMEELPRAGVLYIWDTTVVTLSTAAHALSSLALWVLALSSFLSLSMFGCLALPVALQALRQNGEPCRHHHSTADSCLRTRESQGIRISGSH